MYVCLWSPAWSTGEASADVQEEHRGAALPCGEEDGHVVVAAAVGEMPEHDDPLGRPRRIDAFGIPIGVQLCSDINRPEGTHLLGAQGAMATLNPRATEEATYQRWKVVFRANAMTSACYVLSVNRPYPEQGVPLGGPSVPVGSCSAGDADRNCEFLPSPGFLPLIVLTKKLFTVGMNAPSMP